MRILKHNLVEKTEKLIINGVDEFEETFEGTFDGFQKSSEEDVTSPEVKKKRFGMNPDVETKFLPDRDRDEEESLLREKLRCEWERRQKEVKEEEVQIIYR